MPTVLFQTPAAGIEQYLWPAVFGFISAALIALIVYLLNYRKQASEVHKTEMDLALSIYTWLEPLKMKSLEDAITIRELREELKKCVDGKDCHELKDVLLVVLPEAMAIIESNGGNMALLAKMRELETRLI